MYFLIKIVHESLQTAARRFLKECGIAKKITEQSVSAARNKIKWEAIRILYESSVETAFSGYVERWYGYQIFAIDGTKIELPHNAELGKIFGEEKGSPIARGSIIYDVLNHVVADAQIEPLSVDERTLAKRHVEKIYEQSVKRALVIHDRGYASQEYIEFLRVKKIRFLFRVRTKFSVEIDNFKKKDGCIKLFGMKLRIVKITLDTGEIETLITNIHEIPYDEFKKLYFMRWGVEKEYDILKNKLEITNFSGRTEKAVRQDFFIHMMYANILAAAEWEAQEKIDEENNGKVLKYAKKINTNNAVGVFRENLINILLTKSEHMVL
jgi:hypothetical protein